MMAAYPGLIENLREQIRLHLENGQPLLKGAKAALISPNDKAFLKCAYQGLEKAKRTAFIHLKSFRDGLANVKSMNDIGSAESSVASWSMSIARTMDDVLDYDYENGDVLPPPHQHSAEITKKYYEIFRYDVDDPRSDHQLEAVLNYLLTINNPWAKYARL
ncbi:hypothetical protein [Thalassospira sp. TSL5-1]|uniref:hypothetical protein n=1 Tax=Thalassospira sp. TSL5-1 TaxID=1544451 RepID=UPI00093FF45A|nr:hypothetical protein [Thalassospira sp. TSL5-1]OKH90126.1 hypothetical protein LF95_09665 [Thalassospira sp. TSL5-1]